MFFSLLLVTLVIAVAVAFFTVRLFDRPIERLVVATGTLEPEREVEVRPRTPG